MKNNQSKAGITALELLAITFIVLKLAKIISWSWLWVLSPIWIPATIVFWFDGTKTVVKAQEGDIFDPEKGLAMAVCKKVLGYNDSQSNFNDIFKKWLPKEEKKEPGVVGKIRDMIMTDKGLVVHAEITDPKFATSINESLGILGE